MAILATAPVVIVDDADPAISYGTPNFWRHEVHQNNYQDATYSAGFTNASAKFAFNGTTIAVYGAIIQPNTTKSVKPPSVRITLDGQSKVFGTTVAEGDTSPVYGYNYFGPANVTAGQHTLEFVVEYGDMENNFPFILDYIEYTPLSASTTSAADGAVASPASTDSTGKHKSSVGPIVGGVIGGIVVLGLVLRAAYSRRKRQRLEASSPQPGKEEGVPGSAVPNQPAPAVPPMPPAVGVLSYNNGESYLSPEFSVPAPTSAYSSADGAYAPYASSSSSSPHMVHAMSVQGSSYSQASGSAGYPPAVGRPENVSGKRAPQGPNPSMVYHSDSGMRFAPPDPPQAPPPADAQPDMEVPPEYTEH
ncbi:hypothetical protein GY45DRAFT_860151 [Cubamyces sp. BRFM 1775]|nr:hypothetical protein GY45DRAFT_860151 [Cubamyces sp. BRFM 1775]